MKTMGGVLRAPQAEVLSEVPDLPVSDSARERMRRCLLTFSVLWLILSSISIWRYTWDDSYIIFRYAQNFANGFGLVFNAGQRVEGYSSFLWVALLSGAARVSLDPVLMSKVLGLLFNLASLVAGYFLCRTLATPRTPMYGLGLVLAACNTHIIVGSVAGLETPLFTALLCWSTVACVKAHRATDEKGRTRWWVVASLLFALLVMTRPDGVLAYTFVWIHAAWRFRRRPRTLLAFTLPFFLLYVPYFAWRWHYYGFFFPNIFYVKRGGTLALFARGLAQTGRFLGAQAGGWFLSGLVGLAVLLFPAVETTIPALTIASRGVFEVWSGGVTPGEFRFLISALPLMWVLAERVLIGGLGEVEPGPRGLLLLAGISTFLVAAQCGDFIQFRRHKIEPVQMGMEHAHVELGKWLGAHGPPDATVAVGDIGAIGFWSHRRILDLDGLVDTHIAHLPGVYGEKRDPQYVLRQAPEFIVLRTSNCAPGPKDVSPVMDRAIYLDAQFQSGYGSVSCCEFWPGYNLLLFQKGTQAGPLSRSAEQADSGWRPFNQAR